MFLKVTFFLLLLLGCKEGGKNFINSSTDEEAAKNNSSNGDEIPKPLSIKVTPETLTTQSGSLVIYSATGFFPYDIVRDITDNVAWSSSDSDMLDFQTADNKNIATCLQVGTVDVIAEYKGTTGTAPVIITDAIAVGLRLYPSKVSISLTPSVTGIPVAKEVQIEALAVLSDQTLKDVTKEVKWLSFDETLGTFSDEKPGALIAKAPGVLTVQASINGKKVTAEITITVDSVVLQTIKITPDPVIIPLGTQLDLVATGFYSDGSERDITAEVSWTSDNQAVVTVASQNENAGKITSKSSGSTTITATLNDITGKVVFVPSTAILTSLSVDPKDIALPVGVPLNYTATGTYSDGTTFDITNMVQWESSNPGVVTVGNEEDNDKGKVTVKLLGAVEVRAFLNGVQDITNLTVTSAQLSSITVELEKGSSMPKGTSQKLRALGNYSSGAVMDISTTATWLSGNPAALQVENGENGGRITGLQKGVSTVRVSSGSISKTTSITILDPELVSLEVTATDLSAPLGLTRQFRAIGTYTDASLVDITESADWTFDIISPGYNYAAHVYNTTGKKGKAETVAEGVTKITARVGEIFGHADFTVTEKEIVMVNITGPSEIIDITTSQQMTATAIYTDETTRDVTNVAGDPDLTMTWTVEDFDGWGGGVLSVDTVTDIGKVTGMNEGPAYVRATLNSVKFGEFDASYAMAVQSICLTGNRASTYYCWYLSDLNQSCDEVCALYGGLYHDATRFWVGSDTGYPSYCTNVLNSLNSAYTQLESPNATHPSNLGLGCGVLDLPLILETVTTRYTTPVTNSSDKADNFYRVCACTQ